MEYRPAKLKSHTKGSGGKMATEGKISLRRFVLPDDADDFMVWASDDRVSHFCSWDTYTNKEDLVRYISEAVIPHPWFRAICLDGRPIGAILVTPYSDSKYRGELGYALSSAYWGKGIVSEAVRIVVSSVFDEIGDMERLEALVDVENLASQRVLEKVGFTREGVLRKYWRNKGETRDMVIYSFLSNERGRFYN